MRVPDEHVEREWESVNQRSRAGLIVVAIAAVVFLVFILSNTDNVDINFITLSFTTSEWVMFTILFLLGLIVGWTGSSLRRRSKLKAVEDKR
jgi:uncharacterized integral membrane protein